VTVRRLLAVASIVALVAAGCGGDDDGDLEAYCRLVREGQGLSGSGEIDPADFDVLVDLAPQDIRPAVEQLANGH